MISGRTAGVGSPRILPVHRSSTSPRDGCAVPPSPHPAQALKELPGLDINDLVDRIIFAESGGNTYAAPDSGNRFFRNGSVIGKGPRGFGSSALGAGQFIASSWVDEIKHHQPELVRENPWLHPSIRQRPDKLTVKDADETGLLNSRTDYALARHGTAHLAEQNAARLIDA